MREGPPCRALRLAATLTRKVRVVHRDRESGRIGSTLELRPGLGSGVGLGLWRAEAYYKRAVGSYKCAKVRSAALRAAGTLMGKAMVVLRDSEQLDHTLDRAYQ